MFLRIDSKRTADRRTGRSYETDVYKNKKKNQRRNEEGGQENM